MNVHRTLIIVLTMLVCCGHGFASEQGKAKAVSNDSAVQRHDSPQQERLEKAGFSIEKYWQYFSAKELHILEWGHYF